MQEFWFNSNSYSFDNLIRSALVKKLLGRAPMGRAIRYNAFCSHPHKKHFR
ncbi:hypothetical protein EZS27_014756 [termite gut metagenome]|uniref:Uncharacterized protein n=1 Tax=termite gut metagenome TaxID=433724 RepID=A0A5J4RVG5_9ZZZZ